MNKSTIMKAVCTEFDVTRSDIILVSRQSEKVRARQVFFYVAKKLLGWSHRQIGEYCCRDHTTVGFGIRQIRKDMSRDPAFRVQISALMERIQGAKK